MLHGVLSVLSFICLFGVPADVIAGPVELFVNRPGSVTGSIDKFKSRPGGPRDDLNRFISRPGGIAGPGGALGPAGRVILIDKEVYRLEYAAKKVPGVETLDYSKKKVDAELRAMFGDLQGPDVCIEAVGFHYAKTMLHMIEQKLMLETDPADVLNELIRCCRKGGVISIVGVYAGFTNHFNIGAFMEKALTMRGGQTPVQKYWHLLLKKVQTGALDPTMVITHPLPLDQAVHAYKIFNEKKDGCIKAS
ncbi:sorbitol dehydrogenase, partial [Haematococcus lacustris]